MSEKVSKKANLVKGFFKENPLFVMVLGTCPALATTKSIEAAIGMGLLFTIVLICSNVLISLLRRIIDPEIRIPAYIVVIATFVTVVKMLANAYLPSLYSTLGVFISLIVVNCIVLGRAEAFASKNTVLDSLLDGIGMGLGYTLALIIIAFFREVLGAGGISIGKIFTFIPLNTLPILKCLNAEGDVIYDYSISIFSQSAGAFIVLGIVLAVLAAIKNKKIEKLKKKQIIKKEEVNNERA